MYGAGVVVTLAALSAVTLIGAPQQTPQRTTRETRDRHVYMTVLDKSDHPVTDLTVADVVVKEDGATREISRVSKASTPMQIALLVDDSSAANAMTMDLRQSFTGFVNAIAESNPDTEFSLITFGERPTVAVPFSPSVSAVTRGIEHVMPRSAAGSYLLQAIVDATQALKKKTATRPVIVAFVAEDGPEFSNESRQFVAGALKDAGVSLWTVILQGDAVASSASNERRERAAVITDVAGESGGTFKTILDRQGLTRALANVATQLTSQVDVMYARPDRLIPPSKLEVSVKRPGVRVVAPNWAGQR
jgi:VWFA-related protein